jgi:hypothetical protein
VFVGEARVQLVRGLLLVDRTFPRILDRQGGGDDHDLADAAVVLCRHDHAREPWVDRELGERTTDRRQPMPVLAPIAPLAGPGPVRLPGLRPVRLVVKVEGTQLLEQLHARLDVARIWPIDERKGCDVTEPCRGHGKNHRGETCTHDLGLGELRP